MNVQVIVSYIRTTTLRNGTGVPQWEYGRVGSSSHPIRMGREKVPSHSFFIRMGFPQVSFRMNESKSRHHPILSGRFGEFFEISTP